jgi:alkylation response protein AidB-like acyl-CoA dehydrogenase
MDFDFDTTDQDLRDLFVTFYRREVPLAVVRAATGGFDRQLWDKVRQLGVPALGECDSEGSLSLLQLVFLAEETGYALAPVPVIESIVALRFVSRLSSFAHEGRAVELLASLRSGEVIGSLALRNFAESQTQLVPGGAVADLVLGVRGDDAIALSRDRAAPRAHSPVHGSAPIGSWSAGGAPPLCPTAGRAHRRAGAEWKVLTAGALNGLARRALEIGAAYASERKAFGKPIGTFQGVAHPLADVATALAGSELLARKAAWSLDGQADQRGETLAAMAMAFAAETSTRLTAVCVHLHGGYGAALEYDIQLFHQRAKAWANVGGQPSDGYVGIGQALSVGAPGPF